MQSRTLCFNPTLYRKNLTRFWPMWGMAGFAWVLAVLMLLLELNRGTIMSTLEMRELYYDALTYAVPLISLFYAPICAAAVWSYLSNARSVGLLHALPVQRQGLFVTNFLSGMTMMLLPYAMAGVLLVPVTALYGCFDGYGMLVTAAGVVGESFFYFSTATLMAFLSANIFAAPVLYFIFHFLAVILDQMISMLASGFLSGISGSYTGCVEWLSPTVYLLSNLSVNSNWERVRDERGSVINSWLSSVTLENGWVIGLYAAAGLLFVAMAWLLYRHRRSESAGDVVAVSWMKPVFRWGVTACAALTGGQVLHLLLFSDSYYHVLSMTICMLVVGSIGYYAARMLLAKSLRVFRDSLRGVALLAALCAALCLFMKYDVLGITRRVPNQEQVESLSVWVAGNRYKFVSGTDDAFLEEVLGVHSAIVADLDYIDAYFTAGAPSLSGDDDYVTRASISLDYQLKGGKQLSRHYYLPLTLQRMETEGTYDAAINEFVNGKATIRRRLHLGEAGYRLESADIYGLEGNSRTFSTTETEQLMAAIKEDLENGAWGTYDFFDSYDGNSLEGHIELGWSYVVSETDVNWDWATVHLRPEMTATLELLQSWGVLTQQDLLPLWEKYPDSYDQSASTEVPASEGIYDDPNSFSPTVGSSIAVIGSANESTTIFVG